MNYYKRYMGDYSKKTAHLSLMEHGAYTLLLDALYATEKGLPADYPGLHRICRAMSKPEQAAVAKVADEFFPVSDDGLRRNARAVEELQDAAPLIEAARANGKKGGRPKKITQQKPNGFSKETQDESSPEPKPSPSLRSGEVSAAALGIPPGLLADYLVVRKAKKVGALTETAADMLRREADKASISLQQAIEACCQYGWGGFNAGWYADRVKTQRVSGNKHSAAAAAIFGPSQSQGGVIDV